MKRARQSDARLGARLPLPPVSKVVPRYDALFTAFVSLAICMWHTNLAKNHELLEIENSYGFVGTPITLYFCVLVF